MLLVIPLGLSVKFALIISLHYILWIACAYVVLNQAYMLQAAGAICLSSDTADTGSWLRRHTLHLPRYTGICGQIFFTHMPRRFTSIPDTLCQPLKIPHCTSNRTSLYLRTRITATGGTSASAPGANLDRRIQKLSVVGS